MSYSTLVEYLGNFAYTCDTKKQGGEWETNQNRLLKLPKQLIQKSLNNNIRKNNNLQ